MSYTDATVPAHTDSELAVAHEPGEPAAATLVRAIIARLSHQVWVPNVGWDTNGVTVTARITIAAAGARVPIGLSWRAAQFTLSIDGRRDPLRHSGLMARAEHLATLVADTSAATVGDLAEQEVAERLAATIVVGGLHVACERSGADPAMVAYQCAQCGDIDFDAASGGTAQFENHRCPVCRGVAEPSAPSSSSPTPTVPRRRRRRRPRLVQEELISIQDLAVPSVEQHHGPLADWPLHRLLQQVTLKRFTSWRGDLYEVTIDAHGHRHARQPDPRDATWIGQLRQAGLVRVGLWLFVDIDGETRETYALDLSRLGWKVLGRWALLTRHTGLRGPHTDTPFEVHVPDDRNPSGLRTRCRCANRRPGAAVRAVMAARRRHQRPQWRRPHSPGSTRIWS